MQYTFIQIKRLKSDQIKSPNVLKWAPDPYLFNAVVLT